MTRIKEQELFSRTGQLSQSYRDQLALLLSTPQGTVVLDRDFGIDFACLDSPPYAAQSLLAGQLAEKIQRYIPGLRLAEVRLTGLGSDGTLRLKVVVDFESL